MRVSWENGDGYYSAFEFYKSDNPVVDVEGSYVWLTPRINGDSKEQELIPLTLLFRQKLD